MATARQVVLLGGPTNSMKTSWLLEMAERNPTQPFFILDMQNRIDTIAAGVTECGGVPENVTIFAPNELDERHVMAQCLDWMTDVVYPALKDKPLGYGAFCIDVVGLVWEHAQDYYTFTTKGKHQTELQAKVSAKGTPEFNPGIDDSHAWTRIKGWHRHVVYRPIEALRCHVFYTTQLRDVRQNDGKNPIADKDEQSIAAWKAYGPVLPDAEKHLTQEVYTALGINLLPLARIYNLTLVKDIARFRGDKIDFFSKMKLEPEEDGFYNIWKAYTDSRGVPYELERDSDG